MYKMLFNTGVKPENRLGVPLSEHEEWKNGTLHIAYYLREKPTDGWTFKYLASDIVGESHYLPIVGGGMLSTYAIFTAR